MTTAPKPDALPVVAYGFLGPWKERNKLDWRPRNKLWEPLVRLSDAQASLLAKEADTDRLDWMDTNPGRIKHSIGYRGTPDSWVWMDGNGYGHDAANLRAAIDAARAAADQGGAS